jgi:hypothetical protein
MNAGYIQKHYFIKIQFTLASHLLRSLPRVFHANVPIKKIVAISISLPRVLQDKLFYFTKILSLRVKTVTKLPEVTKSPIKNRGEVVSYKH